MFYVYILECSDKSYYTGYTNNIEKRVAKHNTGKASKYTRSRLPVKLVWSQKFEDKSQAMKMESKIKKMHRLEKERIVFN